MSQLSITLKSMPVTTSRFHKILKASDDFGFVLVPILVPDEADLQGDVISAEDIEKAAHTYMEESQAGGYMHRQILTDVRLVESWIQRSETEIEGVLIKIGTWLGAWRIYNEELRGLIKEGKITGVSIGGSAQRIEGAA